MGLCVYRNIFGTPDAGVHSIRFMNLAVVDVLFTLIVAYIISIFSKYSFFWMSVALFSLGIFFHYLFCVDTTVAKMISKIFKNILTIHNYLLIESMRYIYRT